jgi:hypothetical protein
MLEMESTSLPESQTILQMWLNFCFLTQLSKALVLLLDLVVPLLDLADSPLVLVLPACTSLVVPPLGLVIPPMVLVLDSVR